MIASPLILVKRPKPHGLPIPTGQGMAAYLQRILAAQGRDALNQIAQDPLHIPDLSHWYERMINDPQLLSWLGTYYQHGITLGQRQLVRRKSAERSFDIENAFNVFNPRVLAAVKTMIAAFAQSTLQTSALRADVAINEFKDNLGKGLQSGESLQQLTQRVHAIFASPSRAFMLATTEASRAQHSGCVGAWRDSGEVDGQRWLASADACQKCLNLNGKVVGLDEFFAKEGTGQYSVIWHPPAHPHCMCSCTPILAFKSKPQREIVPVQPGPEPPVFLNVPQPPPAPVQLLPLSKPHESPEWMDKIERTWLQKAKELPKLVKDAALAKVKAQYEKLAKRYGKKYAKAILAAGLAGVPLPIPGSSIITAAPVIAVAELHRYVSGRGRSGLKRLEWANVTLTPEEIEHLGRKVMVEMLRDWQKHLEENPELAVHPHHPHVAVIPALVPPVPIDGPTEHKCIDGEAIWF